MSRQIFIGDLQGCHRPLVRLLDKLAFEPAADQLRFAGDLVNRGGESLQTLRLVHSLRESAMSVLGNHDLHLLAYAHGHPRDGKRNAEFDAVLAAPECDELLGWLIRQPLLWTSDADRLALVHAGVDPRWRPHDAVRRAREVEKALAGDADRFFAHMYGNHPLRWEPRLPNEARWRAITNVLTRMRFCDREGRLDLDRKGGIDDAPDGYRPWFELLHADWSEWTVVFGHWSQLGLYQGEQVIGLDTGCVWGSQLTALVVEGDERRLVSVKCNR